MGFRVMNLIPIFETRGLKLGLSQKIEVECKKKKREEEREILLFNYCPG